ncbi:hypothetical protein ACED98_05290 [Streptococcus thoraltensis]
MKFKGRLAADADGAEIHHIKLTRSAFELRRVSGIVGVFSVSCSES